MATNTSARVGLSRVLLRNNHDGEVHLYQGVYPNTGERVPRCGYDSMARETFATIIDSSLLGTRDVSELTCVDCRNTIHP